MVLDIARAFFHADINGVLQPRRQRRFFAIVDGFIAGEGNGPMAPGPRQEGIVMAGQDPVALDWTAAQLMGFDPQAIKLIAGAAARHRLPIGSSERITLETNCVEWKDGISPERSLRFLPPNYWDSIVAWKKENSEPKQDQEN
ncbi:MAG: DUF362 domain-containing protein, partial [Candidatus Coatesbacteria bacterium]|nr:DUF362 domain-containing protein [Candidatus Coatesbacteria bacterium]